MITRRRFASIAAVLPFAARALAQEPSPRWLLLGTSQGSGIYRASWNPQTGEIGKPALAAETVGPEFLALHPSLPVVYTVNAAAGTQAAVSAFAVDATTGSLTLLNRLGTHGDTPCFVSVDRTGQAAFAANYGGGSLTAYKLGPRGELAQTVGVFAWKQADHGPVGDRQDAAHFHCATLSPDNDFVIATDLGDDLLLAFPIAPDHVRIDVPLRFNARPGSGPRHVVFHPGGRWLYCINELDCTVSLYDWGVAGGRPRLELRAGGTVSTLAPGDPPANNSTPEPAQPSTGCELLLSPDGNLLYTCTRGADSLVTYRINPATGLLTEAERLSCGGRIPRTIALDPSRCWLLSCNQASSTIAVFRHNSASGRLDPYPRSFPANTPMFALWI